MSYLKNYRWLMLLLVSFSLILVPGFASDADAAGKGKGGKTEKVMISLTNLNDWINLGYNSGDPDHNGYTKMVVIAVQTATSYAAGHPAGAYLWAQNEMRTNRSDGILSIRANVATQPMQDVILQRAGIDGDTVVVLTGNNMMQLGLSYFSFRYWGWPKERLRVMNGLIKDYISEGLTWDTNTPAPVGSTDTVCNEDQSTSVDEVRASLGEMMTVAGDSDPNTVVLDVRSSSEFNGTQARTDTAFSGRIKTAVWNEWKNMTTTGTAGAPGTKIKSKGDLKVLFAASGITKHTTVYTY